jgi:biopolymer transport protein ExbD
VARAVQKFDVWFVAADQVYRAVPWAVVSGWAEQGRLAAGDRVRPAGSTPAWVKVADEPTLSGFLFNPARHLGESAGEGGPIELDLGPRPRAREIEDDEVDMIPLIDVSLVLLVFFMLTTVVAATSPVAVPEMKYAQEIVKESDSITIQIDTRGVTEHFYALRLGDAGPTPDDNNLLTLGELLVRLDKRLAERRTPPEIRIACNAKLPGGLVREVTPELHKLQQKGKITGYTTDVNEAKK